MLYLIEIENFYSIKERQTIDLRARQDTTASERLAAVGPDCKTMVPKVVAIFGANASGKSNVLKAVSFLAMFIAHSFSWPPESELPFSRFLDEESQYEPTRLAVEFAGPEDPNLIGDAASLPCRYAYEVIFSGLKNERLRVLSEELKFWPTGSKKPKVLFSRDATAKITGSDAAGLWNYQETLERVLRNNASVISTLAQFKHPMAMRLWHFANTVTSNILITKGDWNYLQLLSFFKQNPDMIPALNREIDRVDLGIRSVSIEETPVGASIATHHNGLSASLPWAFESHGTQQFVKLFPLITNALQNGSLAIIDELDQSLHPAILLEMVRWFYDPKRNKNNAQLWTTAQNSALLETLSKDEIFFCEKDRRGRTSVYALNDVKSVRRKDNFHRKYLGGVYGAVPLLG